MLNYQENHIQLQGCYNFRDLGGFPVDTGATCYRQVYRADALDALTQEDMTGMKALGISTVIDLRNDKEKQEAPDRVADVPDFDYLSLSLMDEDASQIENITRIPSLSELYIQMLEDQQNKFAQIGQIILQAKGGVVFHCTAGKDRTGVTAALLLELAGVHREMIVDSYAKSAGLMRKKFSTMYPTEPSGNKAMDLVAAKLLGSEPENMEATLDYLEDCFGNARQYLLESGLSDGELKDLKDKLTGGM